MPKTIVIIYQHFYPGFKAGGPIQSLTNIVSSFGDTYRFKVITSAFDMNDNDPYQNLSLNSWNPVKIGEANEVNVWYHASPYIALADMKRLLWEAQPDVVYVNGLFTFWSTWPLWLNRFRKLGDAVLILAPRGMLQPGALQLKRQKKIFYLQLLRIVGLFRRIVWHATNAEEQRDIRAVFGNRANVMIAQNLPKKPRKTFVKIQKTRGEAKLVYLSLIAPKKNLLLLLDVLSQSQATISLDICGPVEDEHYWNQCQARMKLMPKHIKVSYKGAVKPELVQQTLEQYHALISLTAGENFGHALYECLSVGRPLITSFFTPWNDLKAHDSGYNVDISNSAEMISTLQQFVSRDQTAFDNMCDHALAEANTYFQQSDLHESYHRMFGKVTKH